MHFDVELGLDRGKTFRRRQLGMGDLEIGKEGHYVV
jgi:hypothetical protein